MIIKKQNFRMNGWAGFTIVELLVVLSIMSIALSIGLALFGKSQRDSRDDKRIASMKQIQNALDLYNNDHKEYSKTTFSGGEYQWQGTCSDYGSFGVTGASGYIPNLASEYIAVLPKDPGVETRDHCYIYKSDGKDYKLKAHLTVESLCDDADADNIADPGDTCNPAFMQALDEKLCNGDTCADEPTIVFFTSGASDW